MTLKEQLRAALDLLDDGRNWGHTINDRNTGKLCIMQAVAFYPKANQTLRDAVGVILGRRLLCPFNDAPERTFPEVKALFERAIAAAE